MEYIGENIITPVIVNRILKSTRPAKIKSGSALYYQIVNNAVDDQEAALLMSARGGLNLRAIFESTRETDKGRLKLKVISSKVSDSNQLTQLIKKDFDIYFRSSGIIYGFRSFPEQVDQESLIFNLPRIVLKIDRRTEPRIETGSIPKKYHKECSTVLFSGEKFYRLECELIDVSSGGLGLEISQVVGDKRYEGVVKSGIKTPIEFVLASKPLFAQANFVYVDLQAPRAGIILENILDNRRQPTGRWVQDWVDKIMFGEAIDAAKKTDSKKRPKRTAIVRTENIREALRKAAQAETGEEAGAAVAAAAAGEETESAEELTGVSEVVLQPDTAEPAVKAGTFRVLLIDSHASQSRLVELFLVNRNDYQVAVKTVEDSQTGLKTVLSDRPDMVLIDPLLEGDINNGVLLIQRIKVNRILRDIPVIGLTSTLDRVTVQKLLAAGVRNVVSKKSPLSVLWEKIIDCL